MKYANDMYPVYNDAEHGGLLVVYSVRHRGFLARVVYFEGAMSNKQVPSFLPSFLPSLIHNQVAMRVREFFGRD